MKSKLFILALVAVFCAGCGTKADMIYTLNCPQEATHANCDKEYESFAECNHARLEHDRDVLREGGMPATCY